MFLVILRGNVLLIYIYIYQTLFEQLLLKSIGPEVLRSGFESMLYRWLMNIHYARPSANPGILNNTQLTDTKRRLLKCC